MADCEVLRMVEMPGFNTSYAGPEVRSSVGVLIDTIIFWLGLSLLFASMTLYVSVKSCGVIPKKSPLFRYLKPRSAPLITFAHLGALLAIINGSLALIVPFNTLPCVVTYCSLLIPLFVVVPPALRVLAFYRQVKLTEVAMKGDFTSPTRPSRSSSFFGQEPINVDALEETKAQRITKFVRYALFLPAQSSKPIPEGRESVSTNLGNVKGAHNEQYERIKILRFLGSSFGSTLIFLVITLPYIAALLALTLTSPMVMNGCNTCMIGELTALKVVLYVGTALPVIVCLFSLWVVRKENDPLFIIFELKVVFIVFGVPALIFLIVSDNFLVQEDFNFSHVYQLCLVGFCLVQTLLPSVFVLKKQYEGTFAVTSKADERDVSSRRESKRGSIKPGEPMSHRQEFDYVLKDPTLHSAFMEHLVAEHAVESLRFYDEINKWAKEYHDVGSRTATSRAKKIVSLFVGDDAVFPVNLPWALMQELRQKLGLEPETRDKPSRTTAALSSVTSPRSPGLSNAGSPPPKKTFAKVPSFKSKKVSNLSTNAVVTAAYMDQSSPTTTPTPEDPPVYVERNFFEDAEMEIKELMRNDAFRRFERTKGYKELKSELGMI